MKKTVAVLFGGESKEHEISLQSSISIINAIDKKKYNIILIGVEKNGKIGIRSINNYILFKYNINYIKLAPAVSYLYIIPGKNNYQFYSLKNKKMLKIDVIFSILHGSNGENGAFQGLFNTIYTPFVGSNVLSSSICMDKDISKRILSTFGISVVPSITLYYENYKKKINKIINNIKFPCCIKPSNQGSSFGVNVANDFISLKESIDVAFLYSKKILIEPFIQGREIEVGVLGNRNVISSVCGEIKFKKIFYDYKEKYISKKTKIIIPAKISNEISNKIKKIAKLAFISLECSIMARVDFFLTKNKKIFLNEINTIPGFTKNSIYPKLWSKSGLDFKSLINKLILLTIYKK
ncbi:ddlA [Wigglesworthia glossinidia endosymbiont of Glossina brevipalpis]|uniref:D-alanine--D-alanine ligase n=1 Tax=Wigglesworthia glossinidia brevipalpis TaxID=36870 RepID=DDL_WIGBR|nr:RecName: Full=D-alanine--D-alanine ligase; AltName: Full=D-Ala-D-Ala ligase; AltName: Full=D-alanylalanine synthetase [Wigglesworthia glossinidia endosymbiont of Glossina brevipalpis]BAC24363.1 ddlA [Wigglesworthia glossinidia endosymbiont of Glossina brevipalpis]